MSEVPLYAAAIGIGRETRVGVGPTPQPALWTGASIRMRNERSILETFVRVNGS